MTVDSSVVNVYNANNQVQFLRQYDGPAPADAALPNGSCPTGTCQQAVISYDGYGRQRTRHVPEQQADPINSVSTDHTTWDYNDDGTLQKITDGRGATAVYDYNDRHQVEKVTYGAPDTIPVPTPTMLGYDEAGNRISVSDNSGGTTYQYDTMSQLISETHQFSGLSTSYTLGYEYNPGRELKKITNQTDGTIVNYAFDAIGRLTGVTGDDNGILTQFGLHAKYRASGALSHEEYGNNTRINLSYDKRLQITRYALEGVKNPASGQEMPEGSDFQSTATVE